MQLRKWIVSELRSEWVIIIIIINTRQSEVEVNGSPLLYSTWWGFNFLFSFFFVKIFSADKRLERQTWWLKLKNPICGSFWVLFLCGGECGGIEKISYCQSRFRVRFGFWVLVFCIHIFSTPRKKNDFCGFCFECCAHTHTHIKKEKYIKTSKDKKLMRFYCICVGSLNNTWGKKPANTYDLKVNNAQKGKLLAKGRFVKAKTELLTYWVAYWLMDRVIRKVITKSMTWIKLKKGNLLFIISGSKQYCK